MTPPRIAPWSARTPISRRTLLTAGAITATALAAGCSRSSSSRSENTIKVAYQKTSSFHQLHDLLEKVKPEFEAANKGITIELVPIEAEQDQYFTKLALMNGSPSTAPDVIYEDTFQIRSDAAAGYLLAIDDYAKAWADWDAQYLDTAKEAGLGDDGKLYGIPMTTDTRGIYFNKTIFSQAGLAADWQPTTWEDILTAARAIKSAAPDVTPLNIFVGKAAGEATTMQGFEMLLYGTSSTLYDDAAKKWITGSKGFVDSLTFMKTVYSEGLGPSLDVALDATVGSKMSTELIPQGKVAIAIDGSWLPGTWMSKENAWPEWEQTIGLAKMPTQTGQKPGFTSMSGGWTLAVGSQSANPQAAFDLIAMALNRDNALKYATESSGITLRKDVAEDEAYLSYNPSFEFFSSLVEHTHFRPTTPDYSQISSNIQVACESVASGQATPEQAAATYDEALISLVGKDAVQAANG
ncbi:extracellular solute-binding protein [Actinomyces slackii]|uniref:Probable ABC transporter-binding protein DR_1438 n=1 Tax=Actinomyces slackii TaxID=52774 RepID=A0A3S4SDT8_9ACTO|nr:extracellular solute-binding protein [Actinomyces slackii]VEG73771.1 Probable ABC transporter-binding protein DR_1438 precursor [Actinomyces slackii]